jgi:hypothetical protein
MNKDCMSIVLEYCAPPPFLKELQGVKIRQRFSIFCEIQKTWQNPRPNNQEGYEYFCWAYFVEVFGHRFPGPNLFRRANAAWIGRDTFDIVAEQALAARWEGHNSILMEYHALP